MPMISISRAAKLFDVSRPTLQKALKAGTITGEKTRAGGSESWQIDTAELARLYKLRDPHTEALPAKPEAIGQALDVESPTVNRALSAEVVTDLSSELDAARAEIEALRAEKAEAEKELAAALAVAEERLRLLNTMKLIPNTDDQASRKGLWSRLFR